MRAEGFIQLVKVLMLSCFIGNCTNEEQPRADRCDYQLVESMPENWALKPLPFEVAKTHEVYLDLINSAKKSIKIMSFYMTLLPDNEEHAKHPSATPGRLVLEALESAARDRKVPVEIVVGADWVTPAEKQRYVDAGINYQVIDVEKLMGGGIQHAKFIVTDEENFYVGSANWDWRALSQVKELGIVYRECETMAKDLLKIYQSWVFMTSQPELREEVPDTMLTTINQKSPQHIQMDGIDTRVFLSASPMAFNGQNNERSHDLETILETIGSARDFVYISVMNYGPTYFRKAGYWPVIENALKAALYERRVRVKLMVARTEKLRSEERKWYKSLDALASDNDKFSGIEVKYVHVPADEFEKTIPHSRLVHDKYIVTESRVFIGTSNWTPDYFSKTCGVGLSIRPKWSELREKKDNIVEHMKAIFEREYYSEFTERATEHLPEKKPRQVKDPNAPKAPRKPREPKDPNAPKAPRKPRQLKVEAIVPEVSSNV